jgi:hypothetical protein
MSGKRINKEGKNGKNGGFCHFCPPCFLLLSRVSLFGDFAKVLCPREALDALLANYFFAASVEPFAFDSGGLSL